MKAKPIILAIVGASGAGKTSLSMFLQSRLNIPAIVSYTTRPMRSGERDGVDHYFTDEESVPAPDDRFAYTEYGGYEYWTKPSQFTKFKVVSYVVDETGLIEMKKRWGKKFTIISVLVKRPIINVEPERIARDKNRQFMLDDDFDVVLMNHATKKEFFRQAIFKLGEQISTNWNWE